MPESRSLGEVLGRLERWGDARDWVGPDPFEGLNSALGGLVSGKLPRQIVVQAYKRSPLPPPWPLRASPRPNAKALALALAGYATPAGRRLPGADHHLVALPRRLEALAHRDGAGGLAWSYHFDVQTRHLFYGAETPNAIATCFVVRALLAAGHEQMARRALGPLLGLERDGREGPRFCYVASGSELIHNANLLVAGTVARLAAPIGDDRALDAASRCAATSIALQPGDGVWPYGEAANLGWSDGFHHAYCLDGLALLERELGVGGEARSRAADAWRWRFFEPDGAARMYADRRFPLETHAYASAIETLCDPTHGDRGLAARIARSAVDELWLPGHERFAHRRSRWGSNRRQFMRWTNAPMFAALATLLSRQAEGGSSPAG